MNVIRYSDADFAQSVRALNRRAIPTEDVGEAVEVIIRGVRARGDAAVAEFTQRFDGADVAVGRTRVDEAEMEAAVKSATPDLVEAVDATLENVRAFARNSLRQAWEMTNAQGARVGEVFHPLGRVGVYVPGGTAPLVSTALMTVPFAVAAGVPEIVATTPASADGSVNAALLFALARAGATEVHRIGGAQAVAALALGTRTIPPVDKIFGPGNRFVVEAKRQLFGAVGIDLLPGPSEIMVLADASARADWVAADLLAQAEHGKDSVVGMVTDSEDLLQAVIEAMRLQVGELSRQEPLHAVLDGGAFGVLERSLDEAVGLVNAFAPEHLSLVVDDPDSLLPDIRTAGAIYVGGHSPVAVGDFLAGPSHVLPTAGAGKAFPGLTADMFQRRTSVVRMDAASVRASLSIVETFARVEGLDAHGRSVSRRIE